ncbi:MAG: 4Fe-4S dicluster domain-containing protein [Candidatus Geothermincolia bacterium]
MMARRKNSKLLSDTELRVEQTMWVESTTLTLDRVTCLPCALCREACPKEAVQLLKQEDKPVLDIDAALCSLCGMCVAICPVGAMRMKRSDARTGTEQAIRPLLDLEGIPDFSRGMRLDTSLCPADCRLCVDACPRGALSRRDGVVVLGRELCLSCGHCANVCPVRGACEVDRLFEGAIELKAERCPNDCDDCVTACPTAYLRKEPEGAVAVDARNCICCGACVVACRHEAIDITRLRVRAAGGFSAVWTRAIDRLLERHSRYLRHNGDALTRAAAVFRKTLGGIPDEKNS